MDWKKMEREIDPRTTIALSDGKSLGDNTLKMFAQASIGVDRPHPRDNVAGLRGCPGFTKAVFARADQVGMLVSEGWVAAGITGHDQIIEGCADVETVATLPFNRATTGSEITCVLFARHDNPIEDLDYLRRFGQKFRVVTEYPKEVTAYLKERGIQMEVYPCSGKAEMLVRIGFAAFGATITETGTSLKLNGLKRLPFPEVFRSTTLLVANKKLYEDASVREYVDFLGRLLKGVLDARSKTLLAVNAPRSSAEAISMYLVERGYTLSGPGIKDIFGKPELCAIDSVVPLCDLNTIQIELTRLGATGFLPLRPTTVL